MRKVFENLIGRLEKLSKEYYKDYNTYRIERDLGNVDGLEHAIEIVNQLAEETSISKMETVGWIPISERLPDKEGTYLVTLGKWETITFASFRDIKNNPHFNADVIAWMELPKPYQTFRKPEIPNNSINETWKQRTMKKFERVE